MVTVQSEQRVVLRRASWETYERLLAERGDDRMPIYAYDRGRLEILAPLLPEHEQLRFNTELVVSALAEEWGLDIAGFGSTTLRREDLEAGVEPDACFYIQSEPLVRGRRGPDLSVDPPPDLAIEIDVTSASLDKLPIYARLGVSEVWRYVRQRFEIWVLEGDAYRKSEESRVLPGVTAEALTDLLERRRGLGSTGWLRRVREWARGLAEG